MPEPANTKTIQAHVAKADDAEIAAVMTLAGMLMDVFEQGQLPRDANGEFDNLLSTDWFDDDEEEHLQMLHQHLAEWFELWPGALLRVVLGYACIMTEKNEIMDPDADYLKLHPRIEKALATVPQPEDQRHPATEEPDHVA